jgi:hypothetical protein
LIKHEENYIRLEIYNKKEEKEESVSLKLFKKDGVVTLGCADPHGNRLDREDILFISSASQRYYIRLCETSNKQAVLCL